MCYVVHASMQQSKMTTLNRKTHTTGAAALPSSGRNCSPAPALQPLGVRIMFYMCIHLSLSLYIYIYICIHTYIHICVYIYIYICTYVFMYVCLSSRVDHKQRLWHIWAPRFEMLQSEIDNFSYWWWLKYWHLSSGRFVTCRWNIKGIDRDSLQTPESSRCWGWHGRDALHGIITVTSMSNRNR